MKSTLTTGEVATYCHVTYWTVMKWIRSGRLKALKLPGDPNRVRTEDFVSFLRDHGLPVPHELSGDPVKRLLIVDDDKMVVELLSDLLSDIEGLEVRTAANGYEAGVCMAQFKPDIIILDLWMPGINGFEVCRHLKYNPETSHITVLAITGYPCEESRAKISFVGADDVLEKPLDTEYLRKKVEALVKGGGDIEKETASGNSADAASH